MLRSWSLTRPTHSFGMLRALDLGVGPVHVATCAQSSGLCSPGRCARSPHETHRMSFVHVYPYRYTPLPPTVWSGNKPRPELPLGRTCILVSEADTFEFRCYCDHSLLNENQQFYKVKPTLCIVDATKIDCLKPTDLFYPLCSPLSVSMHVFMSF